nr:odorant binding protein [Semanotus bifasciatus]
MLKINVFIVVAICFALSRLVVAVVPDDMKQKMQLLHGTCVPATGISEDVVARAQVGDFDDDEKLGCYMNCVMREAGVLDNDEKFNLELVMDFFSESIRDNAYPVMKKCGILVGANLCETAFLICKCVFEEDPSVYHLP